MSKWIHFVVRLVVVGYFFLMLETFLLHDPYVRLAHGYLIAATSWGEPCTLWYEPWHDERPYSSWQARFIDGKYSLLDKSTSERKHYDSEESWWQARRQYNASPGYGTLPSLSGISAYKRDGEMVIGEYGDGFFILDIADNSVVTFVTADEWTRSVEARTGMRTGDLADPKSWLVQTRDSTVLGIMGVYLAVTLPWVTAPFWSKRWRQRGPNKVAW